MILISSRSKPTWSPTSIRSPPQIGTNCWSISLWTFLTLFLFHSDSLDSNSINSGCDHGEGQTRSSFYPFKICKLCSSARIILTLSIDKEEEEELLLLLFNSYFHYFLKYFYFEIKNNSIMWFNIVLWWRVSFIRSVEFFLIHKSLHFSGSFTSFSMLQSL